MFDNIVYSDGGFDCFLDGDIIYTGTALEWQGISYHYVSWLNVAEV